MNTFWKYLNYLSLILILALAGYLIYSRSNTASIEPEDAMAPANKPIGIYAKIRNLLFPERQQLKEPAVPDNAQFALAPSTGNSKANLPPEQMEIQPFTERKGVAIEQVPPKDVGLFAAGVLQNKGAVGVTEKVWQEGHWIGLEVGPLTPALAQANGLPQDVKGVLVDEVTLLAAASGIIAGDVITAINDRKTPDLYAFKEATRPIAMARQAVVTVYRGGVYKKVSVLSNEELGLAQMEAAPMINATDPSPHGYYGPCESCHAISKTVKNTGQMGKDGGDVLTRTAPPIKWGVKPAHANRGTCTNCHSII